MFKLFLILLLIGFFSFPVTGEEETKARVSHQEEFFSKKIFVGKDEDMPLGEEYEIAISPTIIEGNIIAPNSIENALEELKKMLPNWYLNALNKAHREVECSVSLNHIPVSSILDSWIWVNWFKGKKGLLKKEFINRNIKEKVLMLNALQFVFCDYLQRGNTDNLDEMLKVYTIRSNQMKD